MLKRANIKLHLDKRVRISGTKTHADDSDNETSLDDIIVMEIDDQQESDQEVCESDQVTSTEEKEEQSLSLDQETVKTLREVWLNASSDDEDMEA
jgi:hypothetical protein